MTYQGQAGTTRTGTDPAYVPDREVFDAYTHQQIWELARERLAPAELRRVADAWGRTADTVESAFDEHARELTRLSGEWSGVAAAAAMQAATALVQAGDDTVVVCRALRQLMTANSDAAESVRAAVPRLPDPFRPDPDSAVEAATGAQRRTAYNLATAAATASAQDAMTFGYNPTIPASGDSVPRFPAVVATASESSGTPAVSGRGPDTAPSTGPGAAAGTNPESPESDAPGSTTSHIDGDRAPVTVPGRAGDGPQPPLGNDSAPTPTATGTESQPAGTPSDSAPEAGTTADASAPPAEPPQPDNTQTPDSPPHPNAPAAEAAPAAESASETQPAGSEPAVAPSSAPGDRGTVPADHSPRSPASPPTGGPATPLPAGPAPAGPVPAAPPPSAPGHSGSTGGTPGPAHPPGANTPQHRPAPGIPPTFTGGPGAAPGTPPVYAPGATTPVSGTSAATGAGNPLPAGTGSSPAGVGTTPSLEQAPPCGVEWEGPSRIDCGSPPHPESGPDYAGGPHTPACTGSGPPGPDTPVVRAPTTSGSPAGPEPAAVPYSPDPSVRPPAGHTDPVVHPPLPSEREALAPAGTGPNGSTAEAHEHSGQRPARPLPTGVPVPSTAGALPSRPADSERASPDYLHAPNEELTATDPRVPPVLGEYTESERAERSDPGGGSH